MSIPTIGHWINGAHSTPVAGRTFQSLDPENDSPIASVCRGNADDMRLGIDSASEAFLQYRRLSPTARESILLRAADLLQRDASEFRSLLIQEIGSPVAKAEMEIAIATRLLKANAGMSRQMKGRTYGSDVPNGVESEGIGALTQRWSFALRRPLGVVAGITPFNVPLIKGIKHSSMPLATGNTFVWLPSAHTPLIADRLGRLYDEAGLPKGAMNIVHGYGAEIGNDLVSDDRIRAVSFTGSAKIGRHVQLMCGTHGKRVTLELGGKNPLIVLEDADLNAAVGAAVRGAFIYQGQICMATSRVIVADSIADQFCDRFVAAAQSLGAGDLNDPTTVIGPIISETSRQRIREHIQDAIDGGARLLCGNGWQENRLNPTVVSGVLPSMRLFQEETFGPVVSIETAKDRIHALELANASPSMLSAAVFTSNLQSAMSFAESLGTAMVHVNDMTIQQEPEVPFGGDGSSGFGREGMETGIDDFTTWKWVTVRSGGSPKAS